MVDAVRLPVDVEQGALGGPRFKTNIQDGTSGKEWRNGQWLKNRGEWIIGYGLSGKESRLGDVIKLFYACRGRQIAFLFKDWADFEATDTAIGTGTGAQTVFQCVKVYDSGAGGRTYSRTIKAPIAATLVVKLNGTPTAAYTLGAGGVITFTAAPGNGVAITATYQFDIPVRFDTDVLAVAMRQANVGSITSIKIVEVLD